MNVTLTVSLPAIAIILAAGAALIVTIGLFRAFGGNAAKRGVAIGVSSLSLLVAAAFLDVYNPNLDFSALAARAMFSTFGLPSMTIAFTVAAALIAVGSLERLSDERYAKHRQQTTHPSGYSRWASPAHAAA